MSLHPVHLGWVLLPFIHLFKVCFCPGGSLRSPARSTVGAPRMLDERRPHSSPSSQHQLTFHSAGLEPSEAGHPPAHRRQAVRASEGRFRASGVVHGPRLPQEGCPPPPSGGGKEPRWADAGVIWLPETSPSVSGTSLLSQVVHAGLGRLATWGHPVGKRCAGRAAGDRTRGGQGRQAGA